MNRTGKEEELVENLENDSVQPVITQNEDLVFGSAIHPVHCGREVVIGGGTVFPEINFTLPQMKLDTGMRARVKEEYLGIIDSVCQRSVELSLPALIVEFEHLPPMTQHPEWGAEITAILSETLDAYYKNYGLRSALRVTPVDIRDNERPPRLREGNLWKRTIHSFELCAGAGADLLSIESTGGKEVHDEALMNGDLTGILFALGVLGVRDMRYLWKQICTIARNSKAIPAGDTACGFANTAMMLADRKMIPKVLAALVRVASVARTAEAHYEGALGPTKDCAYEGPYLKTLFGVPISMEGKTSACAHLSHIGNISAAACDLWSNESVQNVRLLSGEAPVAYLEQLAYDCRLMNAALQDGRPAAIQLRDWLVKSDCYLDPQAYVLNPEIVLSISCKIASCATALEKTICAAGAALEHIRSAHTDGILKLPTTEVRWLNLLASQLDAVPHDEETLWERIRSGPYMKKIRPDSYGLE